jgi:hypothetical protein
VNEPAPQPGESDFVFLKHKLLLDRMIKPNSRREMPLVFQKHKVFLAGVA